MVIVEEATPSATKGLVPVMVEFRATADPAVKVTVPPDFETGVRIDKVLTSGVRELSVHVEIPLVFVAEHVP
jgi:hypothetical protein